MSNLRGGDIQLLSIRRVASRERRSIELETVVADPSYSSRNSVICFSSWHVIIIWDELACVPGNGGLQGGAGLSHQEIQSNQISPR